MDIAQKYNLFVVEDATESLGAQYHGQYTGTFGDLGCFSFNGNKVITTASGGMVVGKDPKGLEHIKYLINQAKDNEKGISHSEVGFNYRMTNISAMMGLVQMDKLNGYLQKKKTFHQIYRQYLSVFDFISFQQELADAMSSWWLTVITFEKAIDIPKLQEQLNTCGIPTRRNFLPLSGYAPYRHFVRGELKTAYALYEKSLCLPASVLNEYEDIEFICKTLIDIIKKET